eukprot:240377-Rhodomonas_salina.1
MESNAINGVTCHEWSHTPSTESVLNAGSARAKSSTSGTVVAWSSISLERYDRHNRRHHRHKWKIAAINRGRTHGTLPPTMEADLPHCCSHR